MSTQVAEKGRLAHGKGPRPDKVEKLESLQQRLAETSSMVLFDYRGLSVAQMTALRRRTREAGVSLSVIKNSLLARAIEGTPFEALRGRVTGPVSIATTSGDPAVPAKILKTFAKETSAGQITCGVMDGRLLETPDVEALADLPSRDVLLGRLLGTLQAPVAGLPRVLNGVATKLLYALQAIANQKEKG